MDRKEFFAGVRKKLSWVNLKENTELCLKCQSNGQTNYLVFVFLSLNEAVYKCSNTRCMYPFDGFKFKNITDNTVYTYEKINEETAQSANNGSIFECPEKDNQSQSYSAVAATLQSVNHDDRMHESIEEFDFNILDGIFEGATYYSECQPSCTSQHNIDLLLPQQSNDPVQSTSEEFDLNNLNDLLDDLIATADTNNAENEEIKQEKVTVENNLLNTIDVESPTSEKSLIAMPRPRLIKCLNHIEHNLETLNHRQNTPLSDGVESSFSLTECPWENVSDVMNLRQLTTTKKTNDIRPLKLLQLLNSHDALGEKQWKTLRDIMKTKQAELNRNSSQIATNAVVAKSDSSAILELYKRIRQKIQQQTIESNAATMRRTHAKKKAI